VRLDPRIEMFRGGILAPAQSQPPARTGVVIRVGPGMFSEDGRTPLPMHCKPGDRILFERAAGLGLPRCPRETERPRESSGAPGRWAYILVRDGSVIAKIGREPVGEHEQRALDSGDAGLPPRPPGAEHPVSRVGDQLDWRTLHPVQDWLIVRADRKQEEVDPAYSVSHPTGRKLYGANGKARVVPLKVPGESPEESDLWSATVLARGEGLLTITRCLDGDRVGRAPRLAEVGDRILIRAEHPWAAGIDELTPLSMAAELLVREYREGRGVSNVLGKLPRAG
jgi:hypothetical protein